MSLEANASPEPPDKNPGCQHLDSGLSRKVALVVKNLPANAGDVKEACLVPGSGRPLKEGRATHSSILAWRIPSTEESGRLQSFGSQ